MPQSLLRARKRKGKLKLLNFSFTSNQPNKEKSTRKSVLSIFWLENRLHSYYKTYLGKKGGKKVCRDKVPI